MYVYMCVHMFMCVSVYVCTCVCVGMYVCAHLLRVHVRGCSSDVVQAGVNYRKDFTLAVGKRRDNILEIVNTLGIHVLQLLHTHTHSFSSHANTLLCPFTHAIRVCHLTYTYYLLY